jgi:adenosine deaminase
MQFRYVPKVELHCHLDGIVDPAMLRAAHRMGYALPLSPETLQTAYPVRGFDEFIKWMGIASAIEGSLEHFAPILALHIERLKAQNVVYTELMLGSSELPRDPGELVDKFRAFREFVTGLEGGQIQVEFLVAFSRTVTPERAEQIAERVLKLHAAGLLMGVAIAGWPEQGRPMQPFRHILARLHEAGVGIEIHAGEWAGPEAVWEALENGFPDRIGHGVAIFTDPALVEHFQETRLHIELCPISNLKTGSVARIEEHPAFLARELGLSFSVSTDDPGPFENTLESEYNLLAKTFGFAERDFQNMAREALNARFQPKLRYISPAGLRPHPTG